MVHSLKTLMKKRSIFKDSVRNAQEIFSFSAIKKTFKSVDEKKKKRSRCMHFEPQHPHKYGAYMYRDINIVRARKTKGPYVSKTWIPETYIQGIHRRRANVGHSTFLARKKRQYSQINCQYFKTTPLTFPDKYFQNVWGLFKKLDGISKLF